MILLLLLFPFPEACLYVSSLNLEWKDSDKIKSHKRLIKPLEYFRPVHWVFKEGVLVRLCDDTHFTLCGRGWRPKRKTAQDRSCKVKAMKSKLLDLYLNALASTTFNSFTFAMTFFKRKFDNYWPICFKICFNTFLFLAYLTV